MKNGNWIWYPGDFAIELSNKFMTKRYERDVFIPPFWRLDSCFKNVKFSKTITIENKTTSYIFSEGKYNVLLNDKYLYNLDGKLELEPGEYRLVISVYNDLGLPTIKIDGNELFTDDSWLVTCNDHNYLQVETANYFNKMTPNTFKLAIKRVKPVNIIFKDGFKIYDFKQEIMAFLNIRNIEGSGIIKICYGESIEEACDFDNAETIDIITIKHEKNFTTKITKAFRYVVVSSDNIVFESIEALYEYLPLKFQSKFTCSNEKMNEIYEVALHTFHLCTREFMIDGIKRDRWLWAGDAYQSCLMNYYSFFDLDSIKRTIQALLGKEPIKTHINHIMDYSFFFLIGLEDYYNYTNDVKFLKSIFQTAKKLMMFCIKRTNDNGLMEGLPGDWVFIDWDNLDNQGEVALEQMLFYKSMLSILKLSYVLEDTEIVDTLLDNIKIVEKGINKFYDTNKKAFIYSFKNGEKDNLIKKHPNMFAVLLNLCTDEQKQMIINDVLLNEEVSKITTPYMRFYELSALLEFNMHSLVMDEMINYWGGMIDLGATSFWESFDPLNKGESKYAMYGRKYGKSLCHAWGATPLYLIGKYYVGLTPLLPGYEKFKLKPALGSLEWFNAWLPLNDGSIKVYFSKQKISVTNHKVPGEVWLKGKLILKGYKYEYIDDYTVIEIKANQKFELNIDGNEVI